MTTPDPALLADLRRAIAAARHERKAAAASTAATRRNDTARNPDTHAETEGASA